MSKNEKKKKYMSRKRYLKISRLLASLIGMFACIITIAAFSYHYFIGVAVTSMSIGFLWYMIIDLMADRFEDRLIDYEEIEGINEKNNK